MIRRILATLSPLLCAVRAPTVFFDERPYGVDLDRLAGDDPLHLRVFRFELLDPSEIARIEPGVLVFPQPDRVRIYAMTTTELRCRRPGLELFEDPDDLRFAEAGLLHGESALTCSPELCRG